MGIGFAQDQVTAIHQFAHGKVAAMEAGRAGAGQLAEFAGIPIGLFLSMIVVTAFAEELARIIHKFRQEKATDSPKLCY
jgi:hypothetical protein